MSELTAENLACGYGQRTVLKGLTFEVRSGNFFPSRTERSGQDHPSQDPVAPYKAESRPHPSRWRAYRALFRPAFRVADRVRSPSPHAALSLQSAGYGDDGTHKQARLFGRAVPPGYEDAEEALESAHFLFEGRRLHRNQRRRTSAGPHRPRLGSGTRFLIMDEPTSSLDFGNQIAVLAHAAFLARERNKGIVMTTHDPITLCFMPRLFWRSGRMGHSPWARLSKPLPKTIFATLMARPRTRSKPGLKMDGKRGLFCQFVKPGNGLAFKSAWLGSWQ